jgi:cytochrome c oxidase subunit 2
MSSDPQVTDRDPAGHTGVGWGPVIGLWGLLTAAGVVLAVTVPPHLLPVAGSSVATDLVHTVTVFAVVAAPVVAAAVAVAVGSLLGRRSGDLDVPPPDAPEPTGVRTASTVGVAVAVALVVVLVGWGLSVLGTAAAAPDALHVRVTGHQWVWTYAYAGTRVEGTDLVLPVGRPVEFDVTSSDVTHGFHPVQFGSQVEAEPGVVTVLRVTPDRLGPVRVQCSQLCGLFHSVMATNGRVVAPAAFAAWLQGRGATAATADRLAGVAS